MNIITSARVALGQFAGSEHQRRRVVSILHGSVTALASRFLSVAISFISVPLTIGYLGPERYGVWALVGLVLSWLRLADLGLGNGATNAIAGALGADRPDLVPRHISTGMAILGGVAGMLGLAVMLAWPFVDWPALFGISGALAQAEVGPAMAAAVLFFLGNFPLSLGSRTLSAIGQGSIGNLWSAAGNVASLLTLIAVTYTEGGLIWLVFAVSGVGFVVNLAQNLWLFVWHRPQFRPRLGAVNRASARLFAVVGGQFFLIQILALVVFQTDNLVVAHFLGASQVPPYSLTYSLFEFTSLLQTMAFSYLWVAYSEAIARGDIAWVRRAYRLNLAASLVTTAATALPLVFIAQPFIARWAGEAVVPPQDLVLWMAGWSMINALCSPSACLLAAAAQMRAQIVYSAFMAAANIWLSIVLVERWGISGVIAATVISYLIFICGPVTVDAWLLIRRLQRRAASSSI